MMADSGEVLFTRGSDMSDHSEIWDDTALIDAYDKAITGAYKKIANRRRAADSVSDNFSESCSDTKQSERETLGKTKKRHQSNSKHKKIKWKIGDYCRAKYDIDGLVYDCIVTHLDKKNGRSIVEFVGYGNTQSVPISELFASERRRSSFKQSEDDNQTRNCSESDDSRTKRHDSKRSKAKGSVKQTHQSPYGSFLPQHYMRMPSGTTQSDPMIPLMAVPPPPPPLSDCVEVGEEDEALAAMLMSWYMSGYHTGYYQGLKQVQKRAHT